MIQKQNSTTLSHILCRKISTLNKYKLLLLFAEIEMGNVLIRVFSLPSPWGFSGKDKEKSSVTRHEADMIVNATVGQPGLFVKDHISVFITILRSHRHLSTYTAAYYCDVFKSLYKKYIKKHYVIFVREFPVKRVFAIGSKACVFLKEYTTHTSLSVM